ncbi:MAG TPA: ATP-binding protein [Candidatus Acidoferrum sp.]|nr:ATP-binding protein [Candidatus Acidoferrum sp.]
MRKLTHWEWGTVAGFLLLYTVVSLLARPGATLTAFSDMSGTGLWLIAVAVLLWAGFSNEGRTRWFWFLMAFGAALVATNFAAWLYYEVISGREPPNPFWADIPLFLQPVPMMAAAALRPGSRQREQKFFLSTLNFLILVLWWVYLYMFLLYPNLYIVFDPVVYNLYQTPLFVLEFAVLMVVMGGMAVVAEGVWRKIYWHLFGACALYLLAYQWLNAALGRTEYYSGSIYDVPDYAAICWFILIAVRARHVPSEKLAGTGPERDADVSGFLAVLALLSMPVIGLFVLYLVPAASQLRPFRVSVTLIAILMVGACVFLRQMLLARELTRLLHESKENVERLQLAQSQMVQQERLAGIGQLVNGVAHELNNPLTAVMGYSDLLKDQAAENGMKQKLERLGTEARRMKRIIDNLISFARPLQDGRKALDIAAVVRDSLMLCEYQWKKSGISFELNFAPDLPRIPINEGQFKMVFVNLFTNAAQAVEQAPEKRVVVEGNLEAKKIVVRFSDTGPGFSDLDRVFDPFYTTKPVGQGTGLGLSMCYGTVKEHNGRIYAQNLHPNGAAVTIELPAA